MTGRAPAFTARMAALPTEHARLHTGLPELRALYCDLIRAATPPNPQFERERIIAQAANPRELVFLLGLLSEGENEAALLLDLIDALVTAEPRAVVAHVVDEAWYYLRTSIDVNWQLDDGIPCAGAALTYLFTVLTERLDALQRSAHATAFAVRSESERAALLRSLRDALSEHPLFRHEDADGKRSERGADR